MEEALSVEVKPDSEHFPLEEEQELQDLEVHFKEEPPSPNSQDGIGTSWGARPTAETSTSLPVPDTGFITGAMENKHAEPKDRESNSIADQKPCAVTLEVAMETYYIANKQQKEEGVVMASSGDKLCSQSANSGKFEETCREDEWCPPGVSHLATLGRREPTAERPCSAGNHNSSDTEMEVSGTPKMEKQAAEQDRFSMFGKSVYKELRNHPGWVPACNLGYRNQKEVNPSSYEMLRNRIRKWLEIDQRPREEIDPEHGGDVAGLLPEAEESQAVRNGINLNQAGKPTTMEDNSSVDIKPDVEILQVKEEVLGSNLQEVQCCSSDEERNLDAKEDSNKFSLETAQNAESMSFIGTKHAVEDTDKDDETFENIGEEKPCIAALRAAVEAYSANENREKDAEMETQDEAGISSHERLCFENFRANEHTEEQKNPHGGMNPSKLVTNDGPQLSPIQSTEIQSPGGKINISCTSASRSYLESEDSKQWNEEEGKDFEYELFIEKNCDLLVSEQDVVHSVEKHRGWDVWDSSFAGPGQLITHKSKNLVEVQYKCDVCDKSLGLGQDLGKRNRIHIEELTYKCNVCGKTFRNKNWLTRHKQLHIDEGQYKCNLCGKTLKEMYLLTRPNQLPILLPEKLYVCDVCDTSFSRNSDLRRHKKIHLLEKPYKCDICDKRFSRNSHLQQHKRMHLIEKPYKCDVCDKSFSMDSSFQRHKKIHLPEKPYKCDVCGKRFSIFQTLAVHIKIHLGEKPYTCDVCDKSFSRSNDLQRHKTIHLPQKPYKCDVCDKSFLRNSDLYRHKKTHVP